MSDYLDRLVERSFGLSPVAQPRLPALFEPPPDVEPASPFSEGAHTVAPPDQTDAARPPAPAVAVQQPPPFGADDGSAQPTPRRGWAAAPRPPAAPSVEDVPSQTTHPYNANQPRVQHGAAQTPDPIAPTPTPQPQRAAQAPRDYIRRLVPPPQPAASETGEPATVAPSPALSPPRPTLPLSATRGAAVAASDEATAGPPSELKRQVERLRQQIEELPSGRARAGQPAEVRPVVKETSNARDTHAPMPPPVPHLEPGSPRPSHADAPEAVVVRPRVARYTGPQAEAPARAAAPASEPVINVTIGRIEVRAAPAREGQSPPQRQSPAPATMNLQEYLRRRSGGA